MMKLNKEQEKLLRSLLNTSKRLSEQVVGDCGNLGEMPKCKDAAKCLLLVEQLSREIGLIEDRPDSGNTLINRKLF